MVVNTNAVYDPEELALLGEVLDQVMQSLPGNLRTASHRTALARNILALAATGERNPLELARAAFVDVKVGVAA